MAEQTTVLVVDDDPLVREALTRDLQRDGFAVLVAKDGVEGVKVFQQQAPDVTLVDIIMPEQDGIGAILEMRRLRSDAIVIAMSGAGSRGDQDYLAIAGTLGAQAVLQKPVTRESFRDALRLARGDR
jgi:CheY-like chemotaxis protein